MPLARWRQGPAQPAHLDAILNQCDWVGDAPGTKAVSHDHGLSRALAVSTGFFRALAQDRIQTAEIADVGGCAHRIIVSLGFAGEGQEFRFRWIPILFSDLILQEAR